MRPTCGMPWSNSRENSRTASRLSIRSTAKVTRGRRMSSRCPASGAWRSSLSRRIRSRFTARWHWAGGGGWWGPASSFWARTATPYIGPFVSRVLLPARLASRWRAAVGNPPRCVRLLLVGGQAVASLVARDLRQRHVVHHRWSLVEGIDLPLGRKVSAHQLQTEGDDHISDFHAVVRLEP